MPYLIEPAVELTVADRYAMFDYNYELCWMIGVPVRLCAPVITGTGLTVVGFMSRESLDRLRLYEKFLAEG